MTYAVKHVVDLSAIDYVQCMGEPCLVKPAVIL